MSEISLKEYVSKLESALNEKAADEVIQHCRHILRSFPKNVTAYRLMGGALLELGRYEEAGAALQRVLSVLPDDYAAHLGLSDAYTGQNRADDAIWHLERAFEQNPNNTKLIDRLRGLYRRFRKGENVKIQMTSAAVARLQMRNRQYEAAIHTLRGTLQRYPDRVDLKLLLTRALWETGEVLDAAEMAVAVLTVLPNCLEANRLMTELWLSEDRPSDAQPYLYRVEAVDPYLAYELVQGEAPPDDAFRLEELDYRRAAHEVLVNSRPDWLLGITDEIAGGRDESEQRSNWESPLLAGSLARTQEQASPLFDDLEVADTLFDQDAEPAFDSLFDPPAARNQETSDWMSEYLVDTPDADRVALEDSFTTTPVKQLGTQSNKLPMSWALNEDEDDPKLGVLGGTGADAEAIPDWVQAATEHPDFADAYQQDSDDEEESMDWLRDEIFQDEASIQLSSRQTEPLQTPKTGDDELTIDSDALDWYEDPKSRASAASSGSSLGLTDMLRGGDFEWMQDNNAATSPPASSVSDAEPDEWLSLFEPDAQPAPSPASDWISELEMNDEQKPTSNDLPDWMSPSSGETWLPEQDMPDEPLASDVPDWMREFAPQDDSNSSPVVQTGELDWMSDDVPAPADELGWLNTATEDDPFAAPSPAVPTATLDWLNEDAPAAPQRTDSLSWLDDELPTDQPSSSDDETPDWMIDLQSPTGDVTPSEGASIVTGDLGWLNTEDEAEEAAAVPQTDGLSWLNSVEEDDELPADQPSSFNDDETPDWRKELDSEEEAAEAEIPDWMSDLQPSGGDVTEAARIETGDLGWLNTEEEPEAAAVPQTDGLSWLNSVEEDDEQPAEQPSSTDDETPDWMKELGDEEEAVEAEMPDWMSELQPSSGVVTPSEETPVESDDFGWLNTEDEVQEAAAVPQTDGLSWLNSVEEDDEQPADQPSSTDDDETPDWMKELGGEEEAVEADIPEWMSALEPEANAEPAASTEAEPGGFEWMTDAEEAEPATESGEFGWLDAVEEPAQPESSGESGDFEWFTEEEEKQRDAQELAAMTSTPDWLAALQTKKKQPRPSVCRLRKSLPSPRRPTGSRN
jgi:tetratricopeptide (TPR) repeat protein